MVSPAWAKRLETIMLLTTMELAEVQSADARSRDAVKKHEREILEAWALWYDQALESVLRIPVGNPPESLVKDVRLRRAQNQTELTGLKAAFGL